MSHYAKGRRLEYRTIRALEALGYDARRTAGSHGPFDVVATRRTDIRFVQSKANRGPGSVEREKLELFECPPCCTKEIWVWKDRARLPVVEVVR